MQPLERGRRDPREVDVVEQDRPDAGLDPGQVQQFVDHLDQVPGLHLDLGDPVAHLGRDGVTGRIRLTGQRLGEQAHGRERRPQLVGQVLDELGADLLEATQLGDVLEHQPQAADRRPPRAHDEDRAVGSKPDLTGSRTGLMGALDDRLDPGVEEGAGQAQATERARRAVQERVRRRVGQLDATVVGEPHDADPDELDEVAEVAPHAIELEGRGIGLLDEPAHAASEVVAGRSRLGRLTDVLELAATADGHADRDRQQDRLQHDEQDDEAVHVPSIAYRRRSRPGHRPGRPATLSACDCD